jgi:hypothetical protein
MEKKVRKGNTVRKRTSKLVSDKYWGDEPELKGVVTEADFGNALNWYNAIHSYDDAKSFTLTYLKSQKLKKSIIQKVTKINAYELHSIGAMCRILSNGGNLPEGKKELLMERLQGLIDNVSDKDEVETTAPVISIQDRVNAKASMLIAELDEEMEVFFKEGTLDFDVKSWSLKNDIKPAIAKKIVNKFKPQYEEIIAAYGGKDKELAEAYRGWRKPVLKAMGIFLKKIITHLETGAEAAKAIRKPRAKKVKPAGLLVAKMKYKTKDETYSLTSIEPRNIIGASSVWVFNTKTRKLSVYNSSLGLTVSGTSIKGFDPDTSVTKTLRKPESVLKQVQEGTKASLRLVMKSIKTVETKANGRMNEETVIVKVIK